MVMGKEGEYNKKIKSENEFSRVGNSRNEQEVSFIEELGDIIKKEYEASTLSETGNITLREITLKDSDFLYELYQIRDPEDILSPIKYEDQKTFVRNYILHSENTPFSAWNIIEVEGKCVGSVTLNKKNKELGYWLFPQYTGKSIGTKAVKLFIKKYPRNYYTAFIRPKNLPSRKMVEKIGFVPTHLKYVLTNKKPSTNIGINEIVIEKKNK